MISKKISFDPDQKELIKPILPGLPISLFASVFSPDTYTGINWHWHEAFQYCIVTEGTVDFVIPEHTYAVSTGSGIFINYQQLHMIKAHNEKETSSYICLDVPPSFISYDEHSRIFQRYLKPVMDQPVPAVMILSRHTPGNSSILDSILSIQKLLQSEEALIEIDIRILVMSMWKETWLKLQKHTRSMSHTTFYNNDRLKTIFLYFRQHYSEKISLDDIAAQVSLSRAECSRFFKKQTGSSMFEYLTSYRINKSIDLLRDTDMSIAEIAGAVGFCSQSYFTDCFRKAKKITPKKYKELSARQAKGVLKIDSGC